MEGVPSVLIEDSLNETEGSLSHINALLIKFKLDTEESLVEALQGGKLSTKDLIHLDVNGYTFQTFCKLFAPTHPDGFKQFVEYLQRKDTPRTPVQPLDHLEMEDPGPPPAAKTQPVMLTFREQSALSTLNSHCNQMQTYLSLLEQYLPNVDNRLNTYGILIDMKFEEYQKALETRKAELKTKLSHWKQEKITSIQDQISSAESYHQSLEETQKECKNLVDQHSSQMSAHSSNLSIQSSAIREREQSVIDHINRAIKPPSIVPTNTDDKSAIAAKNIDEFGMYQSQETFSALVQSIACQLVLDSDAEYHDTLLKLISEWGVFEEQSDTEFSQNFSTMLSLFSGGPSDAVSRAAIPHMDGGNGDEKEEEIISYDNINLLSQTQVESKVKKLSEDAWQRYFEKYAHIHSQGYIDLRNNRLRQLSADEREFLRQYLVFHSMIVCNDKQFPNLSSVFANLKLLWLNYNEFCRQDMHWLGSIVSSRYMRIEMLFLKKCSLTDADIITLTDLMLSSECPASLCVLKELSLGQNPNIGDDSLGAILHCCRRKWRQLKKLYFYETGLTNKSADIIYSWFDAFSSPHQRNNSSDLDTPKYSFSKIGSMFGRRRASMHNSVVGSMNNIGDHSSGISVSGDSSGVKNITHISHICRLTYLSLKQTRIDGDGRAKLAQMFSNVEIFRSQRDFRIDIDGKGDSSWDTRLVCNH